MSEQPATPGTPHPVKPGAQESAAQEDREFELVSPATPAASSSSQGVAPGWRTASFFLGFSTVIATALGPGMAWINGEKDRELQQQKTHDEISLRYMDLILRNHETVGEREVTLKFLEKALTSEQPRDMMLEVVREQLQSAAASRQLEKDLEESQKREKTMATELAASQGRIAELEAALAAERSDSASQELRAEITAERKTTETLMRQLAAEQQRSTRLEKERDQAIAASGVGPTSRKLTQAELLDRYFAEPDYSEKDETLLRRLDAVCSSFGGTPSFVSYGPDDHGVACAFRDGHVLLDANTLVAPHVPPRFQRFPSGSWQERLDQCSYLGGEPVGRDSPMQVETLCRIKSTGRGVVLSGLAF